VQSVDTDLNIPMPYSALICPKDQAGINAADLIS
jgi:hypothetical protein